MTMTPEQFCYWLQGYTELHGSPPSAEQWKSIQEHLKTVFHKVTPSVRQALGDQHPFRNQNMENPWTQWSPTVLKYTPAVC
jgi:hypothetical protein